MGNGNREITVVAALAAAVLVVVAVVVVIAVVIVVVIRVLKNIRESNLHNIRLAKSNMHFLKKECHMELP
jgi:hypothetical protein